MVSNESLLTITIFGGQPWGFSLKGGSENNKPLVISKLEKNGKAETAGVCVGDVISRINNFSLSGFLNEAVQLVQNSSYQLILQVKRNYSFREAEISNYPRLKNNYNQDLVDQKLTDYKFISSTNCQTDNDKPFYDNEVFLLTGTKDSFQFTPKFCFPQDVASYQNDLPHSKPFPGLEEETVIATTESLKNLPPPMSPWKARDEGFSVERPRLQPVKSLNLEDSDCLSEEESMRSPESGYAGSYGSQARFRPKPICRPVNRHTKEWSESDNLKSIFEPNLSDSKDLVLLGASQRSHKSATLCVSNNSKSSGALSSSSGSLDNMPDAASQRTINEDQTQPFTLLSSDEHKESSLCQPQVGLVSLQRNVFERLCQKSAVKQESNSKMSRDQDIKTKRIDSSDSKNCRSSASSRPSSSTLSPGVYSTNSKRPTSALSLPLPSYNEKENFSLRKRSGDHIDEADQLSNRSETNFLSAIHYFDNKIKNNEMNSLKSERVVNFSTLSAPQPPLRNESSVKAVKNYHSLSYSQLSEKSSFDAIKNQNLDQVVAAGSAQLHEFVSSPSSAVVDKSGKTTSDGQRQERVFGVMSIGNNKNIIAASVTVPSSSKNSNFEQSSRDPACRQINELCPSTNAIAASFNRIAAETTVNASPDLSAVDRTQSKVEHCSTKSIDSNDAKGKYGLVWKTPQSKHRRAHSSDFSTILKDWNAREAKSSEPHTLSVFNKNSTTDGKAKVDCGVREVINPYGSQSPDMFIDDRPSILKSLQDAQLESRESEKSKATTTNSNNEKALSESSDSFKKSNTLSLPHNSQSKAEFNYNNWTSQFKEVDLDESGDDACSPQDRYVYDIKDMSQQVLQVTSFTRKDLEVSPPYPSVQKKRQRFQFPFSSVNSSLDIPSVAHIRSRSHGSENDNILTPIRTDVQLAKPRPKSAGVARSTGNRHAPAMRATVAPSCNKQPSYYPRQTLSLPRNITHSLNPVNKPAPCDALSPVSPTAAHQTNEGYSPSSLSPERKKLNSRSAVIDFVFKKTGRMFDSESSSNLQSPLNSNIDKLRKTQTPIPEEDNEETEQITHRKSSSLLEHDSDRHSITPGSMHDRTPSVTSGERSASLENLTDSGLDMSRASPSDNIHTDVDRLSQSSMDRSKPAEIDSLVHKHDIKPPPRRNLKQHRQRYSNSSNSSSATTISTLSSFSSSSSTSMGKFPTLGEEGEPPVSPIHNVKQSSSSLEAPSSSPHIFPPHKSPQVFESIDTGTYRVAKRKTSAKSLQDDSKYEKNAEVHCSSTKIPVSSSPSMTSDIESSTPNQDDVITSRDSKSKLNQNQLKSGDVLLQVQENICKIFEKVKNSTSLSDAKKSARSKSPASSPPPPPPPSQLLPLDDAAEKLLNKIAQQRQAVDAIISAPVNSVGPLTSSESGRNENKPRTQAIAPRLGDSDSSNADTTRRPSDPSTLVDEHKKVTGLPESDSNQATNQTPQSSHRISSAIKRCSPSNASSFSNSSVDDEVDRLNLSAHQVALLATSPVQVSPLPLLPDVAFFSHADTTSLQQEHPDLTRDILKEDKDLIQVLTKSSKKTLDYMDGVLSRPSYSIVQEGIRYRLRKPDTVDDNVDTINNNKTTNGLPREKLPASSAYYTTSASKAKILNLMKEKLAVGENPYKGQETCDEINQKKTELIMSINNKLEDIQSMKLLLNNEMKENELLGKQVLKLTRQVCTPREQEKYNIFVEDVDKIINLLLSLSGRLARVENTIQMLSNDDDKHEKELLFEKRRKLNEQHKEAKQLKENIDRRQRIVSEILSRCLNREQFADYEHFIKMKSALIIEQRELDDKIKLGQEQMRCLRESLPDDWQCNVDKLIGE